MLRSTKTEQEIATDLYMRLNEGCGDPLVIIRHAFATYREDLLSKMREAARDDGVTFAVAEPV